MMLWLFTYMFLWRHMLSFLLDKYPEEEFLSHMEISYLAYLIDLSRTSSVMVNKSGESGHTFLLPDVRGKDFKLSPLSLMLSVGLSYRDLIMLKYVLSHLVCWFFFSWRDVEFCQSFLHLLDNHMIFLSFILSVWCTTFIAVSDLKRKVAALS